MKETTRRNFFASLAIPLAMTACHSEAPSQKTATQFMDRYYVNMSLKEAKCLSTGLASEKLENQLKLLDGQNVSAGTNVPKVVFHLVSSEKTGDGEMAYIYEVKPEAEDVGRRKVFVKVREENGKWLVSQWTETDQGPK